MPTVKFRGRGWGSFSGFGLGLSVLVKSNVNATAYKDILDNFMLPTNSILMPMILEWDVQQAHIGVMVKVKSLCMFGYTVYNDYVKYMLTPQSITYILHSIA